MNYERLGPDLQCPHHKKQLVVHTGVICEFSGRRRRGDEADLSCGRCPRKGLEFYDMFYRCTTEQCSFCVCRICALQEAKPPVLEKDADGTLIESLHACSLKPHTVDSTEANCWTCDISQVYPKLVCDSFHSKGSQSSKKYGLGCRKCNFDICVRCVVRHLSGDVNC